MNRILPALAVLALTLAGCVAPPADVDPLASSKPTALPHVDLSDTHDHKDRASHDVAWNMELAGWNPIAPDVTKLGRYNHVALHGTRAYVTAYALENNSKPGLAVFDISNGTPRLTATLATPDMTPIDVFPSPDGKYVFLAGHRDARAEMPQTPGEPCTGTPLLTVCKPFVPAGVIMVDVQDEAAPRIVATYTSAPSGAHTVKAHEIGGELYVLIASYGFSYLDRLASSVEIARVNFDAPTGVVIEPVTRFFAKRNSGVSGAEVTFVHDMFVEEHPMLGDKPLLYVAYWDGGVVIADLSDPARPVELSDWRDFDAATYGNIHFTRPVGVVGERHITMAAPEFGSAEHAGEMYVLDTTDPTAPQLLSKWTLPGDPVNDGGYRFSPHNFDPRDGRVVYAHYHGGVWVLDLRQPENVTIQAYVMPVVPEGQPEFQAREDAPNVWAAVWAQDGSIYASDIGTGLYHYRMVSEEPGPVPFTVE